MEVSRSGLADPVGIGDQGVEQGTDLEQLMPVTTRAGQARHLDAEDEADMAQTNLGHEALEARTGLGGGAGAAEVVVDDDDALRRQAELPGTLDQPVLEA